MGLAIEEKGNRVRKKIEEVLFLGANDPEFLSILKEINSNWKDVFRPALAALACEAVGGQPEATDDAGLMFALASAGFGIHDDIIDRSERKHFKTTLLGRHGLQTALLIGDLLIVKAWTTINTTKSNISPEKIRAIIEVYGKLNVEICEAEFMENRCRKKLETDLKAHQDILWQAMAEIEACTRIGAMIGNGDEKQVQALAEFGRRLGYIYRLTDEIRDTLNVEGNCLHRIENESVPLPILFASKTSEKTHNKIESIIKKKRLVTLDIKELLETCFDSKAFEYILDLAENNYEKNLQILGSLNPSVARDSLFALNHHAFASIRKLVL